MNEKKSELVRVICPGCGLQVEAVASEGRVKGYCAVAKQGINILIEEQRISGIEADVSQGIATTRVDRYSLIV